MNWGLIGWVAGTALTIYGIMFVLGLIRSLFGKENRKRIVHEIGESCSATGERFSEYLADKMQERRERKNAAKQQTPMVRIR